MSDFIQQYAPDPNPIPQPVRNGSGATDPGPRNVVLDRLNPNTLAPPGW
ncbi:hypothetical protein [Dictyobacter vulcani]|nr:hypothetical protein [Dictyobacter vulcani]